MYQQIVYWWWRFLVIFVGLLFPPSLLIFAVPFLNAAIENVKAPELLGTAQAVYIVVLIIAVGELVGLVFFIRDCLANRP